jgi:phytanoyl-CoA hydroxylase
MATEIEAGRDTISEADVEFFKSHGYLILPSVLAGEELKHLRRAMDGLLSYGLEEIRQHPDYSYGRGHLTGRPILQRIEYIIDKTEEAKVLLGHPFILRSVEKLQGNDFIPTWDSMVIKLPGEGMLVGWHRDAGTECVGEKPVFNVDFYIDDADLDTCLWVYPGSHTWNQEEILARTQQEGFPIDGAIPIPVKSGDVLFHNILLLHGSPANTSSKLRRVIYYEFRPSQTELELGPHVAEYIPLKRKVLRMCLEKRAMADYLADEDPYCYVPSIGDGEDGGGQKSLSTFRYPHEHYWRL